MQQPAKEFRYFLFSQQLADGVRITTAIVLPGFTGYQYGFFATGLAVSLGALCVAITDAPGPIIHRRNGMLITAALLFFVSLITTFARGNLLTLGVEIGFLSFFFSLFQVYGNRAATVGSACILIMILTMGQEAANRPLLYSLYIVAGGIWYAAISLFFYYIRPYRPAQRVLGDCIRSVAIYLTIKARFYNVHTPLDANYKELVAQQILVNEKQDAVREFFFKTARIAKESTPEGKKLVATFVHTLDLFEDITATYYNYSTLRNRFQNQDILIYISELVVQMAAALDTLGRAVQANTKPPAFTFDQKIRELKARIDAIPAGEENTLILKKIGVNVRRIAMRIRDIAGYFDATVQHAKSNVDHSLFISHQSLDPKLLLHNLHFRSPSFKHALRVALACMVGFAVSKALAYGQHSYWILLTIAFILKPTFSLTKTRNVERICGTVAGGALGVIFLLLVKNTTAQFWVMILLMTGAFTFLRTRYVVMVICTTAYILILFQFLNIPFISVVGERIFDTVLGCAIAFSAGYFLFPDWEAQQVKKYMEEVLLANAAYLKVVSQGLKQNRMDVLAYKLARKNVYVHSANLTAAYQRMRAEPKRRQQNLAHTHQFIVRNHLLFSNIAHLAALIKPGAAPASPLLAAAADSNVQKLHGLSKKLYTEVPVSVTVPDQPWHDAAAEGTEERLLQTSIQSINKLTDDIGKTMAAMLPV